MRHNRQTRRLGRNHSERKALLENLVTSLLTYQQIKTTVQKAKAAQQLADHVITLGKTDTLASHRQVFSFLQNHELTSKLFKEVAPRFKNRQGGYTRVLYLDRRKGDGAQLALLELTEKEIKVKETAKKKKDKEAKAKHAAEEHETGKAQAHEERPKPTAESHARGRADEPKKEKPKLGFFRNISKFFRNKGGG